MFAAEPDAFDVDVVGQVPDFLGGGDGVGVVAAVVNVFVSIYALDGWLESMRI